MMTLRDYKHDLYFSNKEGFEKGMEKGMEKGKAEATLENARKMKAAGISESIISNITELPIKTISQL